MCIYLSLIQASPFDTHCLAQKLRDAASLGSASTLGQTAVSSVRSASHLATALWRPAERQIFRTMAVSAVVREKFLAIKARLWSTFTSTRHVLTHSFESRDREAANIHAASSASATYIIRQVPPRNHSSHASHQHPTVHRRPFRCSIIALPIHAHAQVSSLFLSRQMRAVAQPLSCTQLLEPGDVAWLRDGVSWTAH